MLLEPRTISVDFQYRRLSPGRSICIQSKCKGETLIHLKRPPLLTGIGHSDSDLFWFCAFLALLLGRVTQKEKKEEIMEEGHDSENCFYSVSHLTGSSVLEPGPDFGA